MRRESLGVSWAGRRGAPVSTAGVAGGMVDGGDGRGSGVGRELERASGRELERVSERVSGRVPGGIVGRNADELLRDSPVCGRAPLRSGGVED
jgi:hypothetical protein